VIQSVKKQVSSIDSDVLKDIHVLLVEDDIDNREMLTFTLEIYGARVTAVPSALEALETLSHCQPNILISDIGMSEMDGYMLMQQVRRITQTSQIPAIALTAYVSKADQQKALEAGFLEHLPKPLDEARLVTTILKLVKGHSTPEAQ
jgi:CheY-like chemotaxis protein